MCTALQAVASPLGHSTAQRREGVMLPGPTSRADDGIRTRDPHLGKVMRYQLRYIRIFASRRLVSGLRGARQNISGRQVKGTNPLVERGKSRTLRTVTPVAGVVGGGRGASVSGRRSGLVPLASGAGLPSVGLGRLATAGPARTSRLCPGGDLVNRRWRVLMFRLVRRASPHHRAQVRSHSSAGERPPHTRKVAGSIPAGTTRLARPVQCMPGLLFSLGLQTARTPRPSSRQLSSPSPASSVTWITFW